MLNNAPNKQSGFRTGNWIERNDESRATYQKNNQIRFKSSMLSAKLCDYSDVYVRVRGTITITWAGENDAAKRLDELNKGAILI